MHYFGHHLMEKCKHCLLALGLGAAATALTLEWGLTRNSSLQVHGLDRNGINKLIFVVVLFGSAPSPVNLHWHAVFAEQSKKNKIDVRGFYSRGRVKKTTPRKREPLLIYSGACY